MPAPALTVTGLQLIRGNVCRLPKPKARPCCLADLRAPAGRAWIAKVHPDHTRPTLIAVVALAAQMLCACSDLSTTSSAARYPDLNAPPPGRQFSTDQAQAIAGLTAARDSSERAAAQQALH